MSSQFKRILVLLMVLFTLGGTMACMDDDHEYTVCWWLPNGKAFVGPKNECLFSIEGCLYYEYGTLAECCQVDGIPEANIEMAWSEESLALCDGVENDSEDGMEEVPTTGVDPEPTTTHDASSETGGSMGASDGATDDSSSGSGESSTGESEDVCGDNEVSGSEECDQGPDNGDGMSCNDECKLNRCGDGDLGPCEACDNGALNGTEGEFCGIDCTPVTCGDGVVDEHEGCDSGDKNGSDGECTIDCRLVSDVPLGCLLGEE